MRTSHESASLPSKTGGHSRRFWLGRAWREIGPQVVLSETHQGQRPLLGRLDRRPPVVARRARLSPARSGACRPTSPMATRSQKSPHFSKGLRDRQVLTVIKFTGHRSPPAGLHRG